MIFTRLSGTTALDQTIVVVGSLDPIVLSLRVPLAPTAPASGEEMNLAVLCLGILGDTIYSGGPVPLLVRPGGTASSVTVPLQYTGPPLGGAVVHLVISALAASTVAGVILGGAAGVIVSALDANGLVVPSFTQPITVAIGGNLENAPLQGTRTVSAVAGVATFRDLVLTTAARDYTLVASTAGVPTVTSQVFTIIAAAAHALSLVGGDAQSGIIGAILPAPLRVAVSDAYGNPVSGASVAWRAVTGGGLLQNPSSTSDAGGIASSGWTLGSLIGPQTASATAAGLVGSPVTFTATGLIASTATHIGFPVASPIGITTAGAPLGGAGGITVNVLDAAGAVVAAFNGPVTMAFGQNPSNATLGGTRTVNALNGVATFTDLAITKVGTGYTLVASAAGLPNVTSNPFAIVAAPAAAMALVSGNNQSSIINLLLANPLKVSVADAFGNPVSGTSVVWSILSGGGVLQNPTSTTDASGVASSGWSLGGLIGTQTAAAAVSGLAGSPVTFSATALPLQQTATQLIMSAIPLTEIAGQLLTGTASATLRSGPPPDSTRRSKP